MRKIAMLAVVASLSVSACHKKSGPPSVGNPPPAGPEITLKVQGPSDTAPPGFTPAPPVNGKQYYCQYSGGNLPGGNGGDVQFSKRGQVTFPVHLVADNQFSISGVNFPVDPNHQLSVDGQVTPKQVVIKDTNSVTQEGEYTVQVSDSGDSTTFDCHPKVINN